MKKSNKELTRAEFQLMQIIWRLERGFVVDIVEEMPNPKPAYTTVSTIMRLLVDKKFVGYKSYGRSHQYFPLISKEEYTNTFMGNVKENFFGGSPVSMLSYFARKEDLSDKEREEIISLLKDKK